MAKNSSSFTQYNQILAEIRSGDLRQVYLLDGEEYYFLETILEALEEAVLDERTRSFNHHLFYGKETNVLDVVNVARRYPMMADRQLVVVKEAHQLAKPELIVPYLEHPLDSTVLVWYHPGKKLAANRKPGTSFKKHRIFTANALKESDVAPFVEAYLESKDYGIEPRPLHMLVENSSARVSVIMQELEKVFANVPPGNKIRESHIEEFVGINKEYNVFALQSALAKQDKEKSLQILRYMRGQMNSNPFPMINATLFSYFRKVAIMQSLGGRGDKEIMSILGIPFYFLSEYRNAAMQFRGKRMEEVIAYLHEADLKFKGIIEHSGDDRALLEELIVKILAV